MGHLKEEIELIKSKGFKLIGVSEFAGDDVFIFETHEESEKAYHTFELNEECEFIGLITGWWYDKERFLATVEHFENKWDMEVEIHWLD
jgi:hypothetical protein